MQRSGTSGTPDDDRIGPRNTPSDRKGHAAGTDPERPRFDEAFGLEKAGSLEDADRLYREVEERTADPALRARAKLRRSHVHRAWGVWKEAVRLAQGGRALARELGDMVLEGEALNAEGAVHQARGEHEEARRLFRGILEITDDPRVRGMALQNLGSLAATDRRFEEAEPYFRESAACFREASYRRGEAMAQTNRGRVLLDQGLPDAGIEALEQAAAAALEVADLELRAIVRLNQAEAHLHAGALDTAAEAVAEATAYFTEEANPWWAAECFRVEGDIARTRERPGEAAACYRRALDLAEALEARAEVEVLAARLASVEGG